MLSMIRIRMARPRPAHVNNDSHHHNDLISLDYYLLNVVLHRPHHYHNHHNHLMSPLDDDPFYIILHGAVHITAIALPHLVVDTI